MHYTSDLREMLLNDQTFRTPGKPEANASKTTRTHNHSNRGSDKPLSTLPPPLNPGTTSLFQWISTGQEPLEGTGEDKEGDNPEETLPELMMSEPKGEYRVHASIAENKATLFMIAPQNRSAPTHKQPS